MKAQMIRRIAGTIHARATWIDVADSTRHMVYMINVYGDLCPICCKAIFLTVKRANGTYPVGYIIAVSECKLNEAVCRLKEDIAFRKRYASGRLTADDVEAIIYHASYELIRLSLRRTLTD